jgi:uncharacterized protein (DUF362 family)
MDYRLKRRDFLRMMGGLGVGTFLSPVSLFANTPKVFPDMVVSEGKDPFQITAKAIEALGGMKRFVGRGDIVVVKPNIGWDRTPEQAANTNPEVLKAVVTMCFEAGAKKVKVFDRPVNDPRRCYVNSGIMDAGRSTGADISYIDDRKFKDISIKGEFLKSWPIYKDILEADKIINVPIAKDHSISRLTMAMKNWMGVIGGNRGWFHSDIERSLADISMAIKPTLTVLDAYRILVDNGPSGGDPEDVRMKETVVAGIDQVSVDSYGATFFGLTGEDLDYVKNASSRGIGVMDLSRVRIKKVKTVA